MEPLPDNAGTARTAALRYLRARLAAGEWPNGTRLPRMKELAAAAGVSPPVMGEAVSVLAGEGILSVRRRKGIFAGEIPRKEAKLSGGNLARTQQALSRLSADVMQGIFDEDGRLPSMKELGERYGVCYVTARGMVETLELQSVVRRHKKRFIPSPLSVCPAFTTVVLIVDRPVSDILTMFPYAQNRAHIIIRALERECGRRNLRFLVSRCSGNPADLRGLDGMLGFVLFPLVQSWPGTGAQILTYLARYERPVFYGEGLIPDERAHAFTRMPFCAYLGDDEAAGFTAGRMLIERGFTKAHYFGLDETLPWALRRRNGLVRAFAAAGYPNGVEQCFIAQFMNGPRRDSFGEYMENAARRRRTVWVACDDSVATNILIPNLRGQKKRFPADLSIMGFNDLIETVDFGLTSYNFDYAGAMTALVNTMLQFDSSPRHQLPSRIPVEGYVVDRGSVGRFR